MGLATVTDSSVNSSSAAQAEAAAYKKRFIILTAIALGLLFLMFSMGMLMFVEFFLKVL